MDPTAIIMLCFNQKCRQLLPCVIPPMVGIVVENLMNTFSVRKQMRAIVEIGQFWSFSYSLRLKDDLYSVSGCHDPSHLVHSFVYYVFMQVSNVVFGSRTSAGGVSIILRKDHLKLSAVKMVFFCISSVSLAIFLFQQQLSLVPRWLNKRESTVYLFNET